MKTKIVSLLIVALLLCGNMLHAKSTVLLRLNLTKGTTYEMTMTTTSKVDQKMAGQDIKIDQKMVLVLAYKVLQILPNKNYLMEYSMPKIMMDMNVNNQKMNFNSAIEDPSNPINAALKGFDQVKLNIEMTSTGKVVRVEGMDDYLKKISGNNQLAQSMQMLSDEKSFGSFIEQTFNYFPENEVKKDDKWSVSFKMPTVMELETKMDFEVASIGKDQVLLNVNSNIKIDSPIEKNGMKIQLNMNGSQNGTMTIDSNDGWIKSSELTQKFDLDMKMKNPQTGEDMQIPMSVNSLISIQVEKK
ncbi:MAG: DUF6263 family protein [Prolixibacteraceae bacterium]